MRKTTCAIEDVYRALSLLSSHIDDIQSAVWENSRKVVGRDTRVIFYDCTNYYFEIEDNDPCGVDPSSSPPRGHTPPRQIKRAPPQPDCADGAAHGRRRHPLSFIIFPGNESEQPSLQKIEEMIAKNLNSTSL